MIIGRYAVIPEYVIAGESRFDPETGKQRVVIIYDTSEEMRELEQSTGKDAIAKKWLKQIDECIALGDEVRAKASHDD